MSECPNAIAVSGRIRLARNYPDLPFSSMERPEDAESCIQRASQAMHTGTDEIYDADRPNVLGGCPSDQP